MAVGKQEGHRSTLKQNNKKHNKIGHKSKGQLKSIVKGRSSSILSIYHKAKHELSKLERRNQVKVIRSVKKEKTSNKKRSLGTERQPPFLVCVIVLDPLIHPHRVLNALTNADPNATVTVSKQGNKHISSALFKQRFTFVLPPVNDLYAILDAVKVSTTLLVIWPAYERGDSLGEDQELLLSSIKAQGLPTPVHAVLGYQDMSQKWEQAEGLTTGLSRAFNQSLTLQQQRGPQQNRKKSAGYQSLIDEINHYFPGHDKAKVFQLDKPGDPILCLRQLGSQKQRSLFFRDHRPHLLGEKVEFKDNEGSGSCGSLIVSGYLRGVPLSASGVVHIPGWGDYHMNSITVHAQDPHPLNTNRVHCKDESAQDTQLLPVPERQQNLNSLREEDDCEADSDEDSDDDSMSLSDSGSHSEVITSVPTVTSKVPKSVNKYMASWFVEGVDYGDSDEDPEEEEEEQDEFVAPAPADDAASTICGDDDDRMSIASGVTEMSDTDENYDEKVDYINEMDEYERMRECRDDLEFPDEVDTPRDIPARKRFSKYRGLESFRSSPWDLSENLPEDYKKIFQIPHFDRFRKKVLKFAGAIEGANPGQYITVHIKDVEKNLYREHLQSGSPLVVFGLMPYEHKMAVANYALKSHPTGHTRDIKSKDRLIFHVGCRRFANQPIFSEHTMGDKQKFCRFFRSGMGVVASVFAPITYPPASVLVFRQSSGGRQHLVATGSVYSFDADRCVLKRIILSGHPFKIHKRTLVARYMFFDRDDINWYKPIELRTKYGKKGKIKEALGTHGHMKCQFNSLIKSQDTILLTLYKRVFPKWCYDVHVPRPSHLYAPEGFDSKDEDYIEDEEETEEQRIAEEEKKKEKKDRMMMPPPAKKSKRVHFS